MTQAEMRVAVAKDVKLRLRRKELKPASVYFSAPLEKQRSKLLAGKSTKKAFLDLISPSPSGKRKCEVCGIGALFVSQVCKFNHFTIKNSLIEEEDVRLKLSELFTSEQLESIEYAFEGHHGAGGDRAGVLTAIMDNIIANKGTFKP